MRIVGEPIWNGRSDAEVEEWVRYEAIINLSLVAWPATIVCPYDACAVSPATVAAACWTHPELSNGTDATPSPAYLEPEALLLSGP
jgi:hypothetical protein